MEKYKISGMHCAACQSRVMKAVSEVPGVENLAVNLVLETMSFDGEVDESIILETVKKAGYRAKKINPKEEFEESEKDKERREISAYKKRLITSIILLVFLMYISMGHMIGLDLPKGLGHNYILLGIIEMLLSGLILIIGRQFFTSGISGLIKKSPNMDTLISLGSGISYIWSIYLLIEIAKSRHEHNMIEAMNNFHNLYFESAAMIIALVTVGKFLEALAKGRTTKELRSLINMMPQKAILLSDENDILGKEVEVREIKLGNFVLVKPGSQIPVDGSVISGETSVDESILTGESFPVNKVKGDKVNAGTMNNQGAIVIKAEQVGEDTEFAKIVELVKTTSATKAPIAKLADKISLIFVPAILIFGIFTFTIHLIIGYEFLYALTRAVSVLVVSCPCALGLATPVAIIVASGRGASCGVLFKNAKTLEEAGRVNIIAFDKTGTITKGSPDITDIETSGLYLKENLLKIAGALESRSEHPLAAAVMKEIKKENIKIPQVEDYETLKGVGVIGKLDGKSIFAGNASFAKENSAIAGSLIKTGERLKQEGKTVIYVGINKETVGVIGAADQVKEDSKEAIKRIKALGAKVVMLSGDNKSAANFIGSEVGIDNIYYELKPDEKLKKIKELKKEGKVAMVGDGVNDAPALIAADIGVAVGQGVDVAIESADVVLPGSSLIGVATMLKLGKSTLRNIKENLFWAFFYNLLLIPAAAGLYSSLFGITIGPMVSACAMSLSSVTVCLNALRLNYLFKDKI